MKIIVSKQVYSTHTFSDLASMIEQTFLVMDHEAGVFGFKQKEVVEGTGGTKYILLTYSTNPAYLDSMKEYYDVHIMYLPEIIEPFEIDLTVYKVYLHDGSHRTLGDHTFIFNRADLPRIPYEIVKMAYSIIDNFYEEKPE